MINGDRIQNTPWIATSKKKNNCGLFWRKMFCEANRGCIANWVEESFLGPKNWMRHNEKVDEHQ